MKKKLSILLLGLAIIGAGLFVYVKFFRLTPIDQWAYSESSPREDYIVEEIDGRMFVNNEKAGISFYIPEGWEIREELDDFFVIYTEGAVNNEYREAFLDKGCRILVGTSDIKTDIETLKEKNENDSYYYNYDMNEYETKKIDRYDSLIHEYIINPLNSYFEDIFIIKDNKLHKIGITLDNQNNINCKEQVEKFLEEIYIR